MAALYRERFNLDRRRRLLRGCYRRAALAMPAVAALQTAQVPSGLSTLAGKHPAGLVLEKDRLDKCSRNKPPAAIAAGQQAPGGSELERD